MIASFPTVESSIQGRRLCRDERAALRLLPDRFRGLIKEGVISPRKALAVFCRQQANLSPSLKRARSRIELGVLHQRIKEKEIPSYVFGVPLDRSRRLYVPEQGFVVTGPAEHKYIENLVGDISPNQLIMNPVPGQKSMPMNVLKWLELLIRNDAPDKKELRQLSRLGHKSKHHNQGGGLGPWCERRFGLAAAKLKDAGLIEDFSICGEAALPLLIASKPSSHQPINYGSHEETMAIDAMVKLKSPNNHHEYALIQIKSSGSNGYDTHSRFIAFTEDQMKELIALNPDTQSFFRHHDEKPGEFLLPVQRRIFKMSISHRKINKANRRDQPDIVNFLTALVDYMQAEKETLILDRPYEELSFPQRVNALFQQGFLKLENSSRAEQRALAFR